MQTFLIRNDHEQLLTNTGNGVFGENEENGADDGFEAPRRQQLHELGKTVHEDLHKIITIHLACVVFGRLREGDNSEEVEESPLRVSLHRPIQHDKRGLRPATHTDPSSLRPLANLLDRVFQQLHEHGRDSLENGRRLHQLRQLGQLQADLQSQTPRPVLVEARHDTEQRLGLASQQRLREPAAGVRPVRAPSRT